jgi:hypothetical protein
LYWRSLQGKDCFQQFRDNQPSEFALQLSPEELAIKRGMLAKYKSQQRLVSVFQIETERFRPMSKDHFAEITWSEYPFENQKKPWKANLFFDKVTAFQAFCALANSVKAPSDSAPRDTLASAPRKLRRSTTSSWLQ